MRVQRALAWRSWGEVNDADRFHDVEVQDVDEHEWRHTRHGDQYVTVVIDLTPIRNKTGPARLRDMVEGR